MRNFTLLFFFLFGFMSIGQAANISGQVVDDNNEKLTGALVTLMYPWEDVTGSAVTDDQGRFVIKDIEAGGYIFQIQYLGYVDYKVELTLKDNAPVDLGSIILATSAVDLSEVEIKEKLPMATQQGDTTAFNADAFKTLPDASAEDLIRKIPGVVIQNGQVQAQGEQVQQVLVDGQPFFGNDPNAALKNLPAEIVQKIEVFDQQSDQARFSGIEDGNTTKTINIVTRPNMRNGQFGKVYGGIGMSPRESEEGSFGPAVGRYQAGSSSNLFNNDQRISLIGQLNNVNEQNFSTDDILGITGSSGRRRRGRGRGGSTENFLVNNQDGIANTQAIGINYTDQLGEKVKITGTYFFNHSYRTTATETDQQFTAGASLGRTYFEENTGRFDNFNHRLSARMEINLDSFTSMIFTPALRLQLNDGQENASFMTDDAEQRLSGGSNTFFSDLKAINLSGSLLLRRRFAKRGRTLSLRLRGNDDADDGLEIVRSQNKDELSGIVDSLDYRNTLLNPERSISARLSYSEPLTDALSLMMEYEPNWTRTDTHNEFVYPNTDGGFDPGLREKSLSNDLTNTTIEQNVGLGFRYSLSRDFFAMVRWRGAWSTQEVSQVLPTSANFNRDYFFHLPFAMLRWKVTDRANLRLFYRSSAELPRAEQLISAPDVSNPVQLSMGNPDLLPSRSHRIFTRFQLTDSEKASVFYANLGVTLTPNDIANAIYFENTNESFFEDIVLERGAQLTRPVNVENAWSLRAFTTYGFPVTKLKSNLSFNLGYTLTNSPGLIDNVINEALTQNYSLGLSFSSNFSDNVDFTIGTNTGWQQQVNSLPSQTDAKFLNHSTYVKADAVLPKGLVLRMNLIHQLYRGYTPFFATDYYLLTAGIGKKIGKEQRGEILLSVFDVLNQNTGVERNFTPVYIEDINSKVLRSYLMLSFTYNFRNFNLGKGPTGIEEQKRRRPWE